ncbi:type 2 lanthipeptide synthetase LanM family protein [Streptomyces sp. SP17BM10]|uniref:type 2 lanthipeptide synthetase LanM family protein n=1 Tax=Streptomyces sp. SP17BM10 TaxID=3002530 RepID=UPI002E7876DD|nr:type 2 lanthipeptide synthetase LanM family protein [Streptomyces sp. SP17BM10]MEE1788780.1 type 2 lanthipeptide synthetase LanM family protein [Streptomyces sp. SP17BM10]
MTTPRSDMTARAVPTGAAPGHWWEPGLRPGEPARDGRPAWAAFAEEALARAGAPQVPTGPLPGTTGFRPVVAPLVQAALTRVHCGIPPELADLPAIRNRFHDDLADTLTRQAARTLVLELHAARTNGHLTGSTPEERFRSYVEATAGRPGLSGLFRAYPVLARILARTCLAAAEALTDLLRRFAADRADIVATLLGGADPGRLTAVHRTGDQHRSGHSVAVLGFTNAQRVVYKPRPLRAHQHFNAVIERFNDQPGSPGLRAVTVIQRNDYGWTEFVDRRECTTPEEVRRFYLRQGAWLALLHAFDCTDLHFENLIACGDHPVPVDLETLFHPPAPQQPGGSVDPAAVALAASVHRTGLLPRLILGDDRAVDASGLGGDAGAAVPGESVRWEEAGTDRMRLVRRPGELHGGANRPALAGTHADPADHVDALLDGFRLARRILADDRDGLLALLPAFADDETRVVVRATADYATLLDESTHPGVLRDAADREALLRGLDADGPGWTGVLDEEVADLWNGDVPLFTTRPGTTDLWTTRGRRVGRASDHDGLTRVANRLADTDQADQADQADQVDRADQEWIIRATMTSRSTTPPHEPGPSPGLPRPAARAPSPEQILNAARPIADTLLAQAHRTTGRVNWISLELLGDRYWQPAPAGADLGGGYPGPALFLAQLAELTGTDRYAEAARLALRPVPELLDRLADRPDALPLIGSGAFAGLGGLTYALSRLAVLLDDREIATWLAEAVQLTATAAEEEHSPALADGTAGGLTALLAVHRASGDATARRGARRCADALLSRPFPTAHGFLAGTAGIGWALLRFAGTEDGGTEHERAGLAALHAAATSSAPRRTWCEGSPGIALAIADSGAASTDDRLSRQLKATTEHTVAAGPLPAHSPCHGELGVLELLAHTKDPALAGRTTALLAALDRTGPICGTPSAVPAPGLLTGLAGIGHGLLRLAFPEHTPSALLLQAPIHPRPSHRTP